MTDLQGLLDRQGARAIYSILSSLERGDDQRAVSSTVKREINDLVRVLSFIAETVCDGMTPNELAIPHIAAMRGIGED